MTPSERIFCLSLHAEYACQHRGDCCRAWQVPAEPHVVEFVRKRHRGADQDQFFVRGADGDGAALRIVHQSDTCVFRRDSRCTIHAEGGAMALPVSCRHFPRVVLRDARGLLISLSHYCPTAAALLFVPDPVRVPGDAVPSASPLSLQEPIEGLDARGALPPLLHPGMLSDLAGYDAWERHVIETLAFDGPAGRSLDVIEVATETLRNWTPAQGPLSDAVRAAFAAVSRPGAARDRDPTELAMVRRLYCGEVPLDAPDRFEARWVTAAPADRPDLHRPLRNYLAARAFGNWVAYQGRGLRSIVAWLRACHDVARVIALARLSGAVLTGAELLEAIRLADLVMLHSLDSQAFARDLDA